MEELLRRGLRDPLAPLWPDEYCHPTGESAFKFVTECCWTDNEADRKIALIPAKEYVEATCYEWTEAFNKRQPIVFEKS